MKLLRVLIILLMPLIFLVLGFRAGILTNSSANSGNNDSKLNLNAEAGALTRNKSQQQVNYLVVSIGSRSAGNLKSVWLVSNHVSDSNLANFVPLYPLDPSRSAQLNDLLASTFALNSSGEIEPVFLETLQAMYMLPIDATIILDTTDISQAINLLGGLDREGAHLSGDQFVTSLESVADGSNVSAENHSDVIQGICSQLVNTHETDRLVAFADYLTAHLILVDRQSPAPVEMLRKIITNPQLNCQFPTLQMH